MSNDKGMDECSMDEYTSEYPCSFTHSLIEVFTNFVNGQIDDDALEKDTIYTVANLLFSIFVILLNLNILIAILTGTFSEGSSAGTREFWVERFHYIFQSNRETGVHTKSSPVTGVLKLIQNLENFLERYWDYSISYIFEFDKFRLEQKTAETSPLKDYLKNCLLLLSLPIWILVGFLTFGLLLPRQVKRFILCPSVECLVEKKETDEIKAYIDKRFTQIETLIQTSLGKNHDSI
mmetsp:Transcript_26418/g.25252  ORF Transcript_26418/g.25252 Transcript_26418/m.25252 type:complete len:235 (+) Transcript_26418:1379-2083(+)